MNDVEELKQFMVVHARAQSITDYRRVLAEVKTDEGDGPGSWVYEWTAAAQRLERNGDLLAACRHYNMARFPYLDRPARQQALQQCVDTFDRWRRDHPAIRPLTVEHDGGRLRCWTTGLSRTSRRPLLFVMAGIVTVKEQWAPVLLQAGRLGMAGVVTELPGVGENGLRYHRESWRMLPAILDALRGQAGVDQTYAVTPSFAGHLALRCAVEDARIRGIVTAGAPVREFFTDPTWYRDLPRVTVDTLAHLTGVAAADLPGELSGWALTGEQLGALDIPVCAIVSRRDEIIPAADVRALRAYVRDLSLLENDDVHGSPNHVLESRLWTVLSVLRMRGVRNLQRAAIGTAWRALRVRHRLTRSPA